VDATVRVLRDAFFERHPGDAALILERLAPADAAALLAETGAGLAGGVLGHMSRTFAAACLEHTAPGRCAAMLVTMPHRAAAALLRGTAEAQWREALSAMPPDTAKRVGALMLSNVDSVATVLDARVLTVPVDASMRQARTRFRRFGSRERAPLYGYVVRSDQTLAGVLSLRRVVVAAPGDAVGMVMRTPVANVTVHASVEEALRREEWQRLHVMPVVDNLGVLLGMLRHDALRGRREESERSAAARSALDVVLSFAEGYLKGVATVVMGLTQAGGRAGGTRS
jgi:magnesium transporter